MTRLPALRTLVPALAASLLLAACGSSSKSSSSSTTTAPSPQASNGGAETIAVSTAKIGKVLTADEGRTVYLFEKDKGGKSSCYGACAQAWPPVLTTGKPKAGSGAEASKLDTAKRTDGKAQVTYYGHPLYYYVTDTKPGQTTGNGLKQFGAEWYAMNASGAKVENKSSSKGSGGSSSSSSAGSNSGGSSYSY